MTKTDELLHVGLDYDPKIGYVHMITCINCNWFTRIYIPFGITIKDYLKDKSCERCKCLGKLY